MVRRYGMSAIAVVSGLFGSGAAVAQLTLPVLQPVIPFNYSRGRNVAVTERDRPEFTATGLPAGSFTLYPRLDVGVGFTDNVFQTNLQKRSSAFVSIVPQVRALSDWSRNSLQVEAGGDFRRYTSYSVRKQDGWHLGSTGRLDIGSDSSISVLGSTARQYETRFSGATPADISSAVPYQLSNGQVSGTSRFGRLRVVGIGDYSHVNFSPVTTLAGLRLAQDFRDRDVWTATGQLDYGVTPDVSVFGQVGYSDTDYGSVIRNGLNDRSSKQVRALGGVSMDVSALIRGSFGIGYSSRDYRAPGYGKVAGLTIESRFEYFPTELTTFTIAGRRTIQDAAVIGSSGFFNTGIGARVDHELLRNLILTAGVDYEHDDFRGIDSKAKIFSANGGLRYLVSRTIGVAGTVSYGQRHSKGAQIGPVFDETSGMISLFIQR